MNARPRSRGTMRPSFVSQWPSREGAGNAGCRPHPLVLRAKERTLCARKRRQGSRNNRHSLRNGVTAYTRPPRCPGFLATVARGISTCELDPSVGGSGPRDFAVRIARASSRAPIRPSHPAPTSVTTRPPLFVSAGCRKQIMIFRNLEAGYFCRMGLT